MPLVFSLVALVAAMRVRGLDRGACGPLADRRAAAAARRELAGHLLLAVLVWRNGWMSLRHGHRELPDYIDCSHTAANHTLPATLVQGEGP